MIMTLYRPAVSRDFGYKVHALYFYKRSSTGDSGKPTDLVAEFAECPEKVEMGNEVSVERLVGVASI